MQYNDDKIIGLMDLNKYEQLNQQLLEQNQLLMERLSKYEPIQDLPMVNNEEFQDEEIKQEFSETGL